MTARRPKPADTQAVQVARPYRQLSVLFPRSHTKNKPSGAFDYLRLVDAADGRNLAREGDWIVTHPDGKIEVQSDAEFGARK